jgi:membrane protein DedA with SNARE-associated domain
MFAPILAGSMKLSFKRFLLFDSIALSLFTTIYLLLGFIFNQSLHKVMKQAKGLQNVLFFGALLIIAVVIILFILSRKKRKSNHA